MPVPQKTLGTVATDFLHTRLSFGHPSNNTETLNQFQTSKKAVGTIIQTRGKPVTILQAVVR